MGFINQPWGRWHFILCRHRKHVWRYRSSWQLARRPFFLMNKFPSLLVKLPFLFVALHQITWLMLHHQIIQYTIYIYIYIYIIDVNKYKYINYCILSPQKVWFNPSLINPYIWRNYNGLTATSLEMMLQEGESSQNSYFSSVFSIVWLN